MTRKARVHLLHADGSGARNCASAMALLALSAAAPSLGANLTHLSGSASENIASEGDSAFECWAGKSHGANSKAFAQRDAYLSHIASAVAVPPAAPASRAKPRWGRVPPRNFGEKDFAEAAAHTAVEPYVSAAEMARKETSTVNVKNLLRNSGTTQPYSAQPGAKMPVTNKPQAKTSAQAPTAITPVKKSYSRASENPVSTAASVLPAAKMSTLTTPVANTATVAAATAKTQTSETPVAELRNESTAGPIASAVHESHSKFENVKKETSGVSVSSLLQNFGEPSAARFSRFSQQQASPEQLRVRDGETFETLITHLSRITEADEENAEEIPVSLSLKLEKSEADPANERGILRDGRGKRKRKHRCRRRIVLTERKSKPAPQRPRTRRSRKREAVHAAEGVGKGFESQVFSRGGDDGDVLSEGLLANFFARAAEEPKGSSTSGNSAGAGPDFPTNSTASRGRSREVGERLSAPPQRIWGTGVVDPEASALWLAREEVTPAPLAVTAEWAGGSAFAEADPLRGKPPIDVAAAGPGVYDPAPASLAKVGEEGVLTFFAECIGAPAEAAGRSLALSPQLVASLAEEVFRKNQFSFTRGLLEATRVTCLKTVDEGLASAPTPGAGALDAGSDVREKARAGTSATGIFSVSLPTTPHVMTGGDPNVFGSWMVIALLILRLEAAAAAAGLSVVVLPDFASAREREKLFNDMIYALADTTDACAAPTPGDRFALLPTAIFGQLRCAEAEAVRFAAESKLNGDDTASFAALFGSRAGAARLRILLAFALARIAADIPFLDISFLPALWGDPADLVPPNELLSGLLDVSTVIVPRSDEFGVAFFPETSAIFATQFTAYADAECRNAVSVAEIVRTAPAAIWLGPAHGREGPPAQLKLVGRIFRGQRRNGGAAPGADGAAHMGLTYAAPGDEYKKARMYFRPPTL